MKKNRTEDCKSVLHKKVTLFYTCHVTILSLCNNFEHDNNKKKSQNDHHGFIRNSPMFFK